MNQSGGPLRSHHPDYVIALAIAILLAVGLVMMYSISPILSHKLVGSADRNYYFLNQIKYVVLGIVVWVVATHIRYDRWRNWATWLMGISVVGLVALLVPALSHSSHGATRWLDLGFTSVQPAEVLKLALVVYLAVWFEKHRDDIGSFMDGVVPFTIMVGVACFVVVTFQRDMGTMMVIALATVGMFFAAGMRWRHFLAFVGAGSLALWAAIALFPHRMERVMTFLNPRCDDPTYALDASRHICQALLGVGTGGLFGVGLGHSIQVYGYLPEAANDSIFSLIAEEFGMVGSLAIIALFGIVAYRGLQVARQAPDMFGRLVATGISLWLLFQAVINIGAMLALVPLTGIPLPFISYGGTSLIISLVGAGILLNISKYTVREVSNASSRERRGISRPHYPGPGGQRRVTVGR
jgi:cell division protein FtsW